jgi:hypothetical protein
VDDPVTAYDFAIMFGISKPEPGPYIIVEVWQTMVDETDITA